MAEAGVSTAADFMADFTAALPLCSGFGERHEGFGERREGFRGGFLVYPGWGYYPDYSYYDYSQPYSSQTWYYCSAPAGYYPYVTQCNTGWQTVPAS
jgi:hypothetical protein